MKTIRLAACCGWHPYAHNPAYRPTNWSNPFFERPILDSPYYLKSIANNAEIDVIWEKWQEKLEPLREQLNSILKTTWEDWEIPREVDTTWPDAAKKLHAAW